jgi:hypothetical protein
MSARRFKDKEKIRSKLKLLSLTEREKLNKNHPHIIKILKKKNLEIGRFREHSSKLLGAGFITGSLLFSSPSFNDVSSSPKEIIEKLKNKKESTKEELMGEEYLSDALKSFLPKEVRPLDRIEEKLVEQVFEQFSSIKIKAVLEGEHLNTNYGYIGAEQHLRRFPGDDLSLHGEKEIQKEGIAPGLGAWGYFANSKENMTEELEEVEKWYVAVQTLYLPDWNLRSKYLKDWYKYRKVVVINVGSGKAVVASIADAGPAAWTGKHFGGSPEVMNYLGGEKYKKGKVVLMFVDDPQNKVPLGPVEIDKLNFD